MKSILRSLLTAGLLLAGAARGEEAKPLPRTLDFLLLPTIQYAHSNIYHYTPSGRGPSFASSAEFAPGQRLDLLVMTQGFAIDAEGRADVVYELSVTGPPGAKNPAPGSATAARKRQVDPRTLLYPQEIISFHIESGEPAGEYRFEITCTIASPTGK